MSETMGAGPMGSPANHTNMYAARVHRNPLRARFLTLLTLILSTSLLAIPAQLAWSASETSEAEVKIAYLYNFARYVQWPDSAFASNDAPIVICVLGDGSFVSEAKGIIGSRKVGAHGVQVVTRSAVEQTSNCHILYIPASASAQHSEVISSLGSRSVFTVSESAGFAKNGGVANFIREDRKIRFEINRKAANKAGLKVSARLLRVAKVVG
jgi:hypothetical protein